MAMVDTEIPFSLADMRRALEASGMQTNDTLTAKTLALCLKYHLSPWDICRQLDAFVINNEASNITLEIFGKFEKQLLVEREKERDRQRLRNMDGDTALRTPHRSRPAATTQNAPSFSPQDSVAHVPEKYGDKLSPASAQSLAIATIKYANRTNAGQRVTGWNLDLSRRGTWEASNRPLGMRCIVSEDDSSNITSRYRYMFTPLEQKARVLNKRLMDLQQAMCEKYQISELSPVGVPFQNTITVCGIICCEAASGRINKTSVVLEGSRSESSGRRVTLDLSEVSAYALFPGQVVLIEGINSSGRHLVAKRILGGVPRPLRRTSLSRLQEFHHSAEFQKGQPLSVFVASGPFTTTENLAYEPLDDVLFAVADSKPDVLVLLGPFVDVTHPLVSDGRAYVQVEDANGNPGRIPATFEMLFVQKIVRDGLEALFNTCPNLPTRVILVPSVLDAHHEPVYPQPPFSDTGATVNSLFEGALGALEIPHNSGPHSRVRCMSNPCVFSVNEVCFAVTSADVLLHMSAEEVSNSDVNRLARLASHMLHQQSFYPLFPPPPQSALPLDLRQHQHLQLPCTPDVLLLPSKLAHFAKQIDECLVVNPGQVSKGPGGGTFAVLTIHPLELQARPETEMDVDVPHDVAKRTMVEIVRV